MTRQTQTEWFTLNNRFRYYETPTNIMLERMSDGKVVGTGDGTDMFWDEKTQKPIRVGTKRFYEELRISALNENEDELEAAYFG